ncbi:MAG: hypothetical protein DDT31_00642 [Syntrophomonadaceae bacterium]|nr:hypothetical protein [Bacillota bacterium]
MAEQYVKKNERRVVVDTPFGPKAFSGMSKTWHEKTIKVTLTDSFFHVGRRHVFLTETGWKYADHLKIGDELVREDQSVSMVIKLEDMSGEFMFDLLDVDGGSAYIANRFIHHNCEFLSSDALLINSMKMHQIAGKMVNHENMGFKFWVSPEELGGANKTYMVSCDPATGAGKDFSAIEVFDFPGLNQIAEYRSNDVNIPMLYAKLKWIILMLSDYTSGKGRAEVLWTFERNGIGEAISALYQNDEKQPEHAELYSDAPGKYGMFTSGKTKVLACLQLKQLIEKTAGGLTINSEHLIYELKNFVAKGGTYEAKSGATDDAVMATVGIVRLLKRLSEWNDEAFKQINEYVNPQDPDDSMGDEPVPFGVF